ncbi:RidA family protein [Agromyces laixinhei]|uniref:RidA family protein n=1 Tax=Agromyces laixinhei TaxID=2585717 RepID=UPI00111728B6|nr:RidA family protein [Agromyces laixinhei]
MTVRLLNPDKAGPDPLYHHVAVATGDTHVHIAGQVAWDENGELVAGVEQASREFDLPRPPLAAIGVDILFDEGILVEAEVTAIVDTSRPGPSLQGGR